MHEVVSEQEVQGGVAGVVRSQEELDSLADAWDDLYERCSDVTPFQSHAWVAAWARAYCPPGRLRVVVVRSGDRLLAAAPLYLARRGPWSVLTVLGGEQTDFTDLLLPPEPSPVDSVLIDALVALPGWRLIDLPELRPGAAALRWARLWPGAAVRLPASLLLELPGAPLPEVLEPLPHRTRYKLRQHLRRADDAGARMGVVPADEVAAAVRTLLRLHEEQWEGRGGNPEHLSARYAALLGEAVPRMVAAGQALVTELRLDGEVLAGQVDVVGHRFLGAYLSGISPRLKERIDVAPVLIRNDLELTVAHGLTRFSMMRGTEDYKYRWRPEEIANKRLLLGRPGALGAAGYPSLARARLALRGWAKRRAPWLRDVAVRVRNRRAPG